MRISRSTIVKIFNQLIILVVLLVVLISLSSCMSASDTRLLGEAGVITGEFSSVEPSIAIDSDDNVHIVAAHTVPEKLGIYYRILDNNGVEVTDMVRVVKGSYHNPSLAIDSNNNVHLVYQGGLNGAYGIYYSKLDNNGNILTGEVLVSQGKLDCPSIVVDSSNNIHVVYQGEFNGLFGIYYKKLDINGNGLTSEIMVGKAKDGLSDGRPRIAVDSNDDVHVVWVYDRVELYYKKLDNDGGNITDEIKVAPEISSAAGIVLPSIAVDSNSNVHIVWQDARAQGRRSWDIYYKKLDDSGNSLTNEIQLTDSGRYYGEPVIAVDSHNNVHLVWRDDRNEEHFVADHINYEIYYRELDNNGSKITDDIRISDAELNSIFPSIALDSNNNIHVVWYDSRCGANNSRQECGIYYNRISMKNSK